MPSRKSLHTMIDLLSDFVVFEGRRVVIEIIDGTEINWRYDPPLDGRVETEVGQEELRLFGGAKLQ